MPSIRTPWGAARRRVNPTATPRASPNRAVPRGYGRSSGEMPRGKRPHLVGSAEGQTAVVHQDPGRGRSALFLRHHVTFFTERDRLDGTSVRIDAPLSTVMIVGCLLAIGLAFVAIGSDPLTRSVTRARSHTAMGGPRFRRLRAAGCSTRRPHAARTAAWTSRTQITGRDAAFASGPSGSVSRGRPRHPDRVSIRDAHSSSLAGGVPTGEWSGR